MKAMSGSLSLPEAQQVQTEGGHLEQFLDLTPQLSRLNAAVEKAADFTQRARGTLDGAATAAVAAASLRAGWSAGSLDAFRRKPRLQPEDLQLVLELQQRRRSAAASTTRELAASLPSPLSNAGGSASSPADASQQTPALPVARRASLDQLNELLLLHGRQAGRFRCDEEPRRHTGRSSVRRVSASCCRESGDKELGAARRTPRTQRQSESVAAESAGLARRLCARERRICGCCCGGGVGLFRNCKTLVHYQCTAGSLGRNHLLGDGTPNAAADSDAAESSAFECQRSSSGGASFA